MASVQLIYLPPLLIVQEFIFLNKQSAMAYNEHLAERIKQNLEARKIKYIERKCSAVSASWWMTRCLWV